MKMISSEVLALMVSIILCAGCSVKENRNECPCVLILDFSRVDESVVDYADLIIADDDGFVFTDGLEPEDMDSEMVLSVPRGMVNVGVWSGTEGIPVDGGLEIPYGDDCPPVYFHASVLDTHAETVRENVIMRKNHCRMTVNLNYQDVVPGDMVLSGNVNGYGPDGKPSSGDFFCRMQRDRNTVVLPRQVDNSLVMEMGEGADVFRRFPIGEYIAASGYDWTKPDLDDLTLDIDIALTGIRLVVQGWGEVHKFDIVI